MNIVKTPEERQADSGKVLKRESYTPDWEVCATDTIRLQVEGGWCVVHRPSGAMCFVPDTTHAWELVTE